MVKILEKNKKENDPLISVPIALNLFLTNFINSLVKSLELLKNSPIIIDADILVRDGFVNKVKHLTKTLSLNNSGFGIKVFDYFYNRPRYRGIHVYRTSCIESILPFFLWRKDYWRPEKYVKEKLKKEKNLSGIIITLHM